MMNVAITVSEADDEDGAPIVTLQADNQPERRLDVTFKAAPDLPEPSSIGKDLLLLGAAVYGADKVVPRSGTANAWTRDISLRVPVSNVNRWNAARATLVDALSFLTGDRWNLAFYPQQAAFEPTFERNVPRWGENNAVNVNAVSLFSGGLDSLCGIISHLRRTNDRLVLVGHFDPHAKGPKTDQEAIFPLLSPHFNDRISQVIARVWISPSGSDISLRGRSFLFIALAACIASGYGDGVPILIPENGVIAINPPLTPSRRGSCSTRTTHPFFLGKISETLQRMGFGSTFEAPLLMLTKRQVVANCASQAILRPLIPHAVSCGKRNRKMHWHPERRDHNVRHCGCCLPCIFRRAALHGRDVEEVYGIDFCAGDLDLDDTRRAAADDLRAVLHFVRTCRTSDDAVRMLRGAGGLLSADVQRHAPVIQRAASEIRTFLRDCAPRDIRRLAGIN